MAEILALGFIGYSVIFIGKVIKIRKGEKYYGNNNNNNRVKHYDIQDDRWFRDEED